MRERAHNLNQSNMAKYKVGDEVMVKEQLNPYMRNELGKITRVMDLHGTRVYRKTTGLYMVKTFEGLKTKWLPDRALEKIG